MHLPRSAKSRHEQTKGREKKHDQERGKGRITMFPYDDTSKRTPGGHKSVKPNQPIEDGKHARDPGDRWRQLIIERRTHTSAPGGNNMRKLNHDEPDIYKSCLRAIADSSQPSRPAQLQGLWAIVGDNHPSRTGQILLTGLQYIADVNQPCRTGYVGGLWVVTNV